MKPPWYMKLEEVGISEDGKSMIYNIYISSVGAFYLQLKYILQILNQKKMI